MRGLHSPSLLGHWVTSQAEWTGPPVTRSLLPVCHTAVHGWQLEACKEVSGALLWLGRAVQWVNPGFSQCFWNPCHDCGFQGKIFFRGTLTPGQMHLYPHEVSFGFLSLFLFQKLNEDLPPQSLMPSASPSSRLLIAVRSNECPFPSQHSSNIPETTASLLTFCIPSKMQHSTFFRHQFTQHWMKRDIRTQNIVWAWKHCPQFHRQIHHTHPFRLHLN